MAVREQGHVAVRCLQLGDERIHACAHPDNGLPARGAVAPQVPAGTVLADLTRGLALVLAVVPLEQRVAQLCSIAEARTAAGVERAAQRTGQDPVEAPLAEGVAEALRLAAAVVGQRDVRTSCVSPVPAPLGLAVAHEDDFHPAHAYILVRRGINPRVGPGGIPVRREVPGAAAGWL